MAVDTNETRSRRGLLAAALGGLGALVADGLIRPRAAEAANGDTVKVGQAKSGSALTSITSSASGFKGKSTGSGLSGVIGEFDQRHRLRCQRGQLGLGRHRRARRG